MQQVSTCVSAYTRTPEINDSAQRYTAAEVLQIALSAYRRGRFDGDVLELRASWEQHEEPHLTREQRIAIRLAEMESRHAEQNRRLGRPDGYRYRGGPVDWETGLPAGSLCARLHALRAAPPAPAPTPDSRPRRHLRSVA